MVPEIEEFAKKLVECVRDASIKSNDMDLKATAASPVAKRWRKAAHYGNEFDFARTIIPDVVDETIFYVLQSIDEGLLKLSFTSGSGRVVNLHADGRGELAGWYMGSGGWRAMFSNERFFDDFADLRQN